jgi:hypothetical protein
MNNPDFKRHFAAFLAAGAVVLLASGCNQRQENTPAVSPAAVEKDFAAADNQSKELAQGGVTALQNNDLPEALQKFQALTQRQDLTDEQRRTASQAFANTLQQLNQAARNGDTRAQQALKNYMMTK